MAPGNSRCMYLSLVTFSQLLSKYNWHFVLPRFSICKSFSKAPPWPTSALAVVSRRRTNSFWVWCQSLHRLHLNQILTNKTISASCPISPLLFHGSSSCHRYAVGVHRRVDIYSIESAGIEYSIDMKVNWHETYLQVAPTQVLSIPRLVFQCKSLGQTLGKQCS